VIFYKNELVFSSQITEMGYARVPNGIGSFIIQTPTFSFRNDSINNIENINQNDKFVIYPNPTTWIITIKGKYIDSIETSNIYGQIIKVNNETILINLVNEPKGIYFLIIIMISNGMEVEKVVLEKRLGFLINYYLPDNKKGFIIFQKRLKKYRDYLFTFLYRPEVLPDNNALERAMRNIKIKQKILG
jgi:hypothetical protein